MFSLWYQHLKCKTLPQTWHWNPQDIFSPELNCKGNPKQSPLSIVATSTICASYGPYTLTDSDPNYTGSPTLTDVTTRFTNPSSSWTTVPPCSTSGENKTSVDISALPICLWVINHQFMNHKCAGESQYDLWEGFFSRGVCERQMSPTGLQSEWCSFFHSGQVDEGKEQGWVGNTELTFPPHVTSYDTWYAAKVKGKGKKGSVDLKRAFTKGGSEKEEVKLDAAKEEKLWSVWVLKGQFQDWLTWIWIYAIMRY